MTLVPARAVLFDNDGVLVDSETAVVDAWATWARDYGFAPADVLEIVHGHRSRDTVALLLGEGPRADEALRRIDALEIAEAAAGLAIPGAVELTRAVSSWAVVTSGTRELATARLAAAGIPAPAVLITADDVAAGKPAPDGYRAAAAALGVDPADTVVLEDAPSGIAAARAAGVGAVIGVSARALGTDADLVVPDLTALRWTSVGLHVEAGAVLRPTVDPC